MTAILYSVERLNCSRHDIAEKLLSNNNHSVEKETGECNNSAFWEVKQDYILLKLTIFDNVVQNQFFFSILKCKHLHTIFLTLKSYKIL